MLQLFLKIIKFGLAGTVGIFIDFGITWLCKEKLRWNKYLSNVIGFSLAVVNNYILNRIWTFKSTNPRWEAEFGRFVLLSLIGLGLNNLFLYLFHQKLKMNFYAGKLVATLIVFVWNFTSNLVFNFH